MRRLQYGASRRFVDAARFHADKPIFDEVEPADAMSSASLVQALQQRGGREAFAVDGDRIALFKGNLNIFGLVGRRLGGGGAAEYELFRLDPGILQNLA